MGLQFVVCLGLLAGWTCELVVLLGKCSLSCCRQMLRGTGAVPTNSRTLLSLTGSTCAYLPLYRSSSAKVKAYLATALYKHSARMPTTVIGPDDCAMRQQTPHRRTFVVVRYPRDAPQNPLAFTEVVCLFSGLCIQKYETTYRVSKAPHPWS